MENQNAVSMDPSHHHHQQMVGAPLAAEGGMDMEPTPVAEPADSMGKIFVGGLSWYVF
jgi:hypothetical protein